ncbi:MAG: SpoIIIAH-like family protein [Ruminococcaceae bacterium]|nr:SpoIIIAH-like family protein [Oscillospiraceae bacterium]
MKNNTQTKNNTQSRGKKAGKIIAALMVFVLGGALFANWYINSAGLPFSVSGTTKEDDLGQAQYVSATTAQSDYFKESRLKREKTRDNTMSELNAVIDNDKASNEQKKSAVDTYAKLSERAQLESDIETLICAKGVSNCIVVLGDKSCEVVVPASELNDTLALQIKEIVSNKAQTDAEHITVSSIK